MIVFYTLRKFRCFSYHTLIFRTFSSFREIRRISFCKNHNFDKSTQSISMKFSEKHAVIVFYTLRKFRCFSYHTLIFRTFSSFREIRRISFCKNHNFDKSTQSIIMKFSEKHAMIVFYTLRKFRCFSYHTLFFRTFSLFSEIRRISLWKNHEFHEIMCILMIWKYGNIRNGKKLCKSCSETKFREIPVSFLLRGMTRNEIPIFFCFAKQAEFRRNTGPFRLVPSFAKKNFWLEIGNPRRCAPPPPIPASLLFS